SLFPFYFTHPATTVIYTLSLHDALPIFVKKLSAFHEPELLGRFLTVNALTLEVISHQVLRVPRCPSCGKRRDCAGFTPWIKDERAESQGRLAYRRPGHVGENGGGR